LNSIKLAQTLYRASRIENGHPRDAWGSARRLAGYLCSHQADANEEWAFSRDADGRIGISQFRANGRGKTKDFTMISIEAGGISGSIWKRLSELAQRESVVMGSRWK
jgi:hypothetical protein